MRWGQQHNPDALNNGNLNRQEHWIKNSQDQVVAVPTQNYDYDSLNRLQRVYEGDSQSPIWHQDYVYDRWGNRTINQSTTNGVPKPNFGVDPNTNRLTAPAGYTMDYDAAGNLTNDMNCTLD